MYTITKYAQSCFLIEAGGRNILIDPGDFVSEQNGIKPADWPTIDVVLVTHKHPDHADKPGLKYILDRDRCPLYTNQSFAEELKTEGIPAIALAPEQTVQAAGLTIRGVAQHHGDLPPDWQPGPENLGFMIDETLYHTGDSIPLPTMPQAEVLFVPVSGPQMGLDTARNMIDIVKPKLAIPMHFSNVKKYPITIEDIQSLSIPDVTIRVMRDQESLTWPLAR